ncbi:hypothetical protein COL5a_002559 [Colletotrichum fioriniae]|uniref:uncharacterized protein n=1 Tax=Colletotrichum fioriniae TaxID=710243 RepID=UPI002300451A|nr:uncharacterized protein COL516b_001720 [Colletotrichum fioriniae]KAJ0311018.1 hypothetical protein COL516b_001720 [Colletotrichum fioriniae]KAJ0331889.1 hypothetical protein COL5a_002559 [Colletotrichum fioriniae]KAJ3940962.1 hypothetical protein N0V96_008837 [Colletotrichum fioriniae]
MKFSLLTLITLISAASAISVDAGLIKRQCIAEGGLCFTSTTEVDKPCCGGLICNTDPARNNANVCGKKPAEKRDVNANIPKPLPVPRAMPEIPRDEPIWG